MSRKFQPLRIPKRQEDPEKRPLADDDWEDADSDYTPASSRAPSHAFDAILAPPKSPSKSFAFQLNRRRFNRYFTIALGSLILIFILLLVGASHRSRRQVESMLRPPPPPPVYEKFPFLTRYYGGIRRLVSRQENVAEYPGDGEETLEMLRNLSQQAVHEERAEYTIPQARPFSPLQSTSVSASIQECFLNGDRIRVPQVHVYDGVVNGFPDPVMGSYELFGLDKNVCFDRFGRLGPYGYGYSQGFGGIGAGMEGDTEGSEYVWKEVPEVDYRNIRWGDAQNRCIEKNKNRFAVGDEPTKTPRQVVLVRTWQDYQYDAEDIMYLRSLIAELSLASGAEYTVHFLIHVKDHSLPIWVDEAAHQRVLDESLPAEFRGMGTLWSEAQMAMMYGGLWESWYRDLPVYGVYRSTYLPLQWFAHTHPEYDFFWHWEMDIRYTGHFYHLFDRVSNWAKIQPRKGLWERNGRFYVPTEHGSYEDFRHMVRIQTEQATRSQKNFDKAGQPVGAAELIDKPVWGPLPPEWNDIDTSNDPQPPTSYEKDNYEWGVGEDADFITFNPLFDPDQTGWILADDVTGYNTSGGMPPRRTAIITASRLSRKLLLTMHNETAIKKHTMFSEMWPGSCALHHGLKAVYAPHPVYIDRRWPTDYLAAIFNGGKNGASGGTNMSPFEDARQRNFLGTTWYYHAQHSAVLYGRWLGHRVNNDGGPDYELAGEGRMCLPAMLLHPIKQVDLVYEQQDVDPDMTRDDMEVGNAGD